LGATVDYRNAFDEGAIRVDAMRKLGPEQVLGRGKIHKTMD
jgi:hypothetical protein